MVNAMGALSPEVDPKSRKNQLSIIPNYAFAHYSQDRRWMGTGAVFCFRFCCLCIHIIMFSPSQSFLLVLDRRFKHLNYPTVLGQQSSSGMHCYKQGLAVRSRHTHPSDHQLIRVCDYPHSRALIYHQFLLPPYPVLM